MSPGGPSPFALAVLVPAALLEPRPREAPQGRSSFTAAESGRCHRSRGDGGEETGRGTRCLQPSPLTGQAQVRARPSEPAPRRRGSEDSTRPGHTQGAAVQPSPRRQSRSPPGQTWWQGCGLSCHPTLQSCGPSDVAEDGLSACRLIQPGGSAPKLTGSFTNCTGLTDPGWGWGGGTLPPEAQIGPVAMATASQPGTAFPLRPVKAGREPAHGTGSLSM